MLRLSKSPSLSSKIYNRTSHTQPQRTAPKRNRPTPEHSGSRHAAYGHAAPPHPCGSRPERRKPGPENRKPRLRTASVFATLKTKSPQRFARRRDIPNYINPYVSYIPKPIPSDLTALSSHHRHVSALAGFISMRR